MVKNDHNVKINDNLLILVQSLVFKLKRKGNSLTVENIVDIALGEYLTDRLCDIFPPDDK